MLVVTLLLLACNFSFAAEPKMQIRLKDGSFSSGKIVFSSSPKRLGWKCEGFENAFEFDLDAVRSVTRIVTPEEEQAAEKDEQTLLFELTGGNQLAGQLISIDDEWLTVKSKLLGTVKLSRQEKLAIRGDGRSSQLIYPGIAADGRWQALIAPEDWTMEAGSIVTSKKDVTICGHVDLPVKSQINLTLAWSGVPEFVLSLGVKVSGSGTSIINKQVKTKLEVWDKQLVLVREVDGNADIAMLADVTEANPKIELKIFFDQDKGALAVTDPYGKLLGSLTLPCKADVVGSTVFLTNLGRSIALERFEVRQWDGVMPNTVSADDPVVIDDAGKTIPGNIVNYDDQTQELLIRASIGEETKLPLSKLQRGGLESVGGQTNEFVSIEKNMLVYVQFMDRTRLSGDWQASKSNQLCLKASGLSEPIQFSAAAVRAIQGTAQNYTVEDSKLPTGTIKIGENQFAGVLLPNSTEGSRTAVHWQPHGSLQASAVSDTASGSIAFTKQKPIIVKKQTPVVVKKQERTVLQRMFGFDQFDRPAPARNANDEAKESDVAHTLPDTLEIRFRSGDAIHGKVMRIEERGMTFTSSQTKTDFAAHEQIDQISFNPLRAQADIASEKRERLLTVPRSMKKDPPTHLFISVTGDYLRGRLVKLDEATLTIEVRSELLELPVAQVAQIVWLHDRDWSEQKRSVDENEQTTPKPDEEKPFQIHTVTDKNQGLTLQPLKVVDGVITGRSDLLGESSVAVKDLSQLLFGRDIEDQVMALRKHPWKLSLAIYPRVYREDGSDGATAQGENYPIVGKPAPDFTLQTLDGKKFRLSEQRDRIVVLDFWASWCGPCMQTMPLVDEVINELGTDKIHLAAVNIEEPAAKVRVAIERLKVGCDVLLDQDGQTAAAYGAVAIPQTVIIDRTGNVTHVFVGGGTKFIEEFRAALRQATAEVIP